MRFRKDRPTTGKAARGQSSRTANAKAGLDQADQELFEALRARRMELAREQSVPPYVIFPDTTLIALATERPMDEDEMLGISGIGQSKLERYGDAFLEVITAYSR